MATSRLVEHKVFPLAVSLIIALVLLVFFGAVLVFGAEQPGSAEADGSVSMGSCGVNLDMNIYPAESIAGNMVTFAASGTWYDSCVPRYQSYQIDGNAVRIDAAANPPGYYCALAFTPWAFSVGITPSLVGMYTVDLYISRYGNSPVFCGRTQFASISAPVSAVISTEGGELTQSYPGHITSLTIPPGALSSPGVFTISYHLPESTTGRWQGIDHFFDLTGTQTTFLAPLTITAYYSDSARGAIIPGTENLYGWQNGQWTTDGISLTDRWSGGQSAQIARLSLFGILGEPYRPAYLPLILQ